VCQLSNVMINMKFVIGSLIISFGILFVVVVVLAAINLQAPDNAFKYLGVAWLVVAVFCYPLAKKIVRE